MLKIYNITPLEQTAFKGHIYIQGRMKAIVSLRKKDMKLMLLSELKIGCRAVIDESHLRGSIRRRLYDLGLHEKCEIECVGESILSDPRAYLIKGTVFALRNSDACKIYIK